MAREFRVRDAAKSTSPDHPLASCHPESPTASQHSLWSFSVAYIPSVSASSFCRRSSCAATPSSAEVRSDSSTRTARSSDWWATARGQQQGQQGQLGTLGGNSSKAEVVGRVALRAARGPACACMNGNQQRSAGE